MTLYLEREDGSFVAWLGEELITPVDYWGEPTIVEPEDGPALKVMERETRFELASHPLSIEFHWTNEELAILKLYRPEPASVIPQYHRVVSTGVERVEGVVRFVRQTEEIPLDERKAGVLSAIAARRWEAETGGLTFDTMRIPTDDKTQSRVDQIVKAFADGDITGVIRFKMPSGFVELTESHLRAIKKAGAEHIQACFDKEASLVEAVQSAADHPALDAITFAHGWPNEEI